MALKFISFLSKSWRQRERMLRMIWAFWNLKTHPQVTHLFSTRPYFVSSPNSSTNWDPVIKYLSLWELFSFKPQRSCVNQNHKHTVNCWSLGISGTPREMSQWREPVLCKCEDLGSGSKDPCRKAGLGSMHLESCFPKVRWEAETGESPDVHGSASVNKRPASSKMDCKE